MLNMIAHDHGKRILACAGAAVLALIGGCTASRRVPPPVGPTGHFSAIPTPPISDGTTEYAAILGPVTGSGSRVFTVSVRPSYTLWLGCLGPGGFARVKSPLLGLDTEMPCGSNGRVSGYQFEVARAPAGQEASVRVTAPHAAKWKLRIDGAPPK